MKLGLIVRFARLSATALWCAAALVRAVQAEEKLGALQTALSSTTISGYVDVSAHWNPRSRHRKHEDSKLHINTDNSGNIVEVSINGYSWVPLVPIWRANTPLTINAISADRLEGLPAGTSPPTP